MRTEPISFLPRRVSAALGIAASMAFHAACGGETGSGGIDTHVHLYLPEHTAWTGAASPLSDPHLAADFARQVGDSPIRRVIVIEAGIVPTHNQWMLDHARENPLVAAVIGNLDLADPGTAAELERLAIDPKFRGIRNRARGRIDFDSATVRANLAALEALNLVFETGLSADAVDSIAGVAAEFSELTIVLDHLGGGTLGADEPPAGWWLAAMDRLAGFPNVYVKLSMFDFAVKPDASPERVVLLTDPIIAKFGVDRLLYGSNWPVSPDVGKMYEIFSAAVAHLPEGSLEKILIANPEAAYGLDAPPGSLDAQSAD